MKKHWPPIVFVIALCQILYLSLNICQATDNVNFIVKPYLQLGDHPSLAKEESLELFWVTDSTEGNWALETRHGNSQIWQSEKKTKSTILSYSVPNKLYLFDNSIHKLIPGEKFEYRLSKNGNEVYRGTACARKSEDQPYRFALFGDTGSNTLAEKKIIYQTYINKPDFLVIAGDIVYSFGCLSEYLEKFFPYFTSEKVSAEMGAPLLSSVVTLAVIGNHDIAYGDNKSGINLDKLRDALAFYELWSSPLNGPLNNNDKRNIPKLLGSHDNISRYLQAAGSRYPIMSNYSFDYGNSHWLILDANPYMDWTNKKLREWVTRDLEKANKKIWKFVCFHQPGFSIDKIHNTEQRMRLLSDIFQNNNVDIVFSGHAHNYQRSYPLIFKAKNAPPTPNSDGTVDGEIILDKQFNGKSNTSPKGVIYIVSGGGGAALYGSMNNQKIDHRLFTDQFNATTHSLTLCDVNNKKLLLRQISEDGKNLDSFVIEK